MSKFLTLVENYNPENSTFVSDVHDLKMLLKSHGKKFGVSGDGVFYIDDAANEKTYVLEIKDVESSNNAEEDVESINAGTGTYEIDKEVQNLANTASSGLKGFGARLFGTSAQQAKARLLKDRNWQKMQSQHTRKAPKELEMV
jgi:hypothetical protein